MFENSIISPIVNNPIILIADDSEIVRNFVVKALSSEYTILMAANGKDTIDIIEANINNTIAWVLLDLNMPEMGGFSVLDYFKDNNLFRKIPVTIISGDNSEETVKRVYTYDVVEMLVKPLKIESIQIGISKALNFVSQDR
mgnify:FL=1